MLPTHFWGGAAAPYQINQSLRFNSADSAYLNRTPGSAGNRKTWTWSGWVKRGTLGTTQAIWGNYFGANDNSQFRVYFNSDNTLYVGFYNFTATVSNAVFRDASAWYHITVSFDSTQSTASNRLKVYVNGTELSWATDNRSSITLNGDFAINAAQAHYIGYDNVANYFNGYLAEINFIDGSALTPSSFGEPDPDTGAWIPKKYSGSYGTNGFYLKYESSGIGTDSSGNGNNWTPSGFSTTPGSGYDVMSDTPTNNYATLNPLAGAPTLSNGNLDWSIEAKSAFSTIGVTSGKYYVELTMGANSAWVGLSTNPNNRLSISGSETVFVVVNDSTTRYAVNSTKSADTGATFTTSDVIGIALDADAKICDIYKNNTKILTFDTFTIDGPYFIGIDRSGAVSGTHSMNFGQRGAFAYTPPTGFKALNTANLPEPTIKKGSKYFNTVTYTGNGTARSITTGHSSDFVWTKLRNGTQSHQLYDIVRGVNQRLQSDDTSAEAASANSLTQFNSDGFDLGTSAASNLNGYNYVAWSWDANGTGSSIAAGSIDGTNPTIASTVSANASAGFSIVTYTGNGSSSATVGHGLGVAPKMVIVKMRSGSQTYPSWYVRHESMLSNHNGRLELPDGTNNTITEFYQGGIANLTSSTLFAFNAGTQGNANNVNTNGNTYVAYCFSEVAGYSKFGSYTGNGSSDGPFVFCGFRPAWVMIKTSNAANEWVVLDTARDTYNVAEKRLVPNSSSAELTNVTNMLDVLSNGFKIRTTDGRVNTTVNYIFAAFAEHPFKYANAR